MKYLKILLTIVVILFLSFGTSFAADETEKRLQGLESEIIKLKAELEHYQFSKEEVKEYRNQIAAERNDFVQFIKDLLDNAKWIVSIIIIIVGAVLTFFGFETWKNIKRNLERKAEKRMKSLVDKKLRNYEEKIKALDELVKQQICRDNCKILIVANQIILNEMKKEVDELDKIVKKIECLDFEQPDFNNNFEEQIESKRIDMVVYLYNENYFNYLENIIDVLELKNTHITLIVYSKNHLEKSKKEKIDTYFWSLLANSPSTLISHVYSLAHAFKSR